MFDEVNTSDPYIYFVIVNSIANLPKQFFKVKASYLLDKAHFHRFFIVSKALYNHINPILQPRGYKYELFIVLII